MTLSVHETILKYDDTYYSQKCYATDQKYFHIRFELKPLFISEHLPLAI